MDHSLPLLNGPSGSVSRRFQLNMGDAFWRGPPQIGLPGPRASPYTILQCPPWRPSSQGLVGQKDLPSPIAALRGGRGSQAHFTFPDWYLHTHN